jgi:hypothetical protein
MAAQMKPETRIAALARITGLIMDQELANLQAKKAAQAETRRHIATLDQTFDAGDVALAASALVSLRYAGWAERKKATLNVTLAQQTVATMAAEDAARMAFARNAVMEKLAKR